MIQVATLLVVAGIAGLFWLDRDPKTRTSPALWLPFIWLSIAGSRPVSSWLQIDSSTTGAAQYMEGNPFDRNFWLALVIVGVLVILYRRTKVLRLIRANFPAFAFLAFCAISIAWSDYPDVAFKRWIKFLGDYVMVLIILTDRNPLAALKRTLSRVAFLLLPVSILLIKYYPALGRSYALHWSSTQFFTGVTQDKNMLGVTCLVFGLGGSWAFLQELAGARRKRILVVHGAIFGMAVWLLLLCNSMTSLSCFTLATLVMAAHTFLRVARKPLVVHLMVLGALLICFAPLFLGLGGGLINSLGRDSTLTGRTQLWQDVLAIGVNPIVGTGFESFWLGWRLDKIWQTYWWHPIEAHNGYIETYLNLGIAGLTILALLIGTGYRSIVRLLRRDPEAGRIRIGFFVVGIAYNFTEAAIHTLSLVWIFFLLSLITLPKSSVRKMLIRQPSQANLKTSLVAREHVAARSREVS